MHRNICVCQVCSWTLLSVRSLYDSDAQDAFLESLSSRIKVHDRDIERMCNKNYQGFIESVSELLKVKSDALKLKVHVYAYTHMSSVLRVIVAWVATYTMQ